MKKQEREQAHEENQGGHTSSEENEPPLADIKEEVGHSKTSKTVDGKEDNKVHVKKEMKVFEDAEEPVDDSIPDNLEPSALKPDPARKYRLDTPKIYTGQKFYHFLPGGAALAQVKRVFGGKKPHVAIQYMKDGRREDIDLSTMQIIIANGWDA
uniref:Uncharacterized protein n=1 Tax=Globisporangium ultimum (strain ATCC 200006 / CBS 805.95 / DAOM BR144) TaxID=431595 RepID=K3WE25_GLOUD